MKAVLVTTAHRGVFFGYLERDEGPTLRLKDARNCIYWESSLHGFLGLASQGPGPGCKIGAKADIVLYDVTCVADVSEQAALRWEAAPWSQ